MEAARKEEMRKLAAQLDMKPQQLNALARVTWGQPFVEERDRRANVPADAAGTSSGSR